MKHYNVFTLFSHSFFDSPDNLLSEEGTEKCGVPLGSILGHLFSLLYINDISQALSNSYIYLYKDDSIYTGNIQ